MPPLGDVGALTCRDISKEITAAENLIAEIELISKDKDLVVAVRMIDEQAKNKAIRDAQARLEQMYTLQREKKCR